MSKYEKVIGLEVHVELATKTKIFCGCLNEFGGEANTHTCPVCTGMPGSLPVLNKEVVNLALRTALALNCEITSRCKFDRKNYFYPDNPQNYQISQLYLPIGRKGYVEISPEDGDKRIGITEIHMEEDAGKLIHDTRAELTLVDYNRSGTPLVEIVTEPDLRSGEEVVLFLEKLRQMLQYLGASDCKLEEGSMRADVNLSVRKRGDSTFGTRTEMKNLNSFKAIIRAIEEEEARQIEILDSGEEVIQETRRWDDEQLESFSMRSKEDAKDYRYFPDPDLPIIFIDEKWISTMKKMQPEFSHEKKERYQREYELSDYDASLLVESIDAATLFEATVSCGQPPKQVANFLLVEGNHYLRENKLEMKDLKLTPEHFSDLLELLNHGKINQSVAKDIFLKMCVEDFDPISYVDANDLGMISDDSLLQETISSILSSNPKAVQEFVGGKKKAFGFLMGQTMQAMEGKADPKKVREVLGKELEKVDK